MDCNDTCAVAGLDHADLFVMNEDGTEVKPLWYTGTSQYKEFDPEWGVDGTTGNWVILFKREPAASCTPDCPQFSVIWKVNYDRENNRLDEESLTQFTDPSSIPGTPVVGFFGDYDPGLDPTGTQVAFGRRLDNTPIRSSPDQPRGDFDIFVLPLNDPMGTPEKITGHCDGDLDCPSSVCDPELCPNGRVSDSADLTPTWSPVPAEGDQQLVFVRVSVSAGEAYDLFRIEQSLAEPPSEPIKVAPDNPPGDFLDENIDTGPCWHPCALGACTGYDGPELIFDRKVLSTSRAEGYIKLMGLP